MCLNDLIFKLSFHNNNRNIISIIFPFSLKPQGRIHYDHIVHIYLAPGGGCEVLFSPGLSVCLCVCLSVCVSVCPADILVFYFSAIRRDIDLTFIQDTYRVMLDSLKKIDLHVSKVKVTGTVHCFLKVVISQN